MAMMTVRRACALDPEAAKTVRDLAARWNASQAEVIRHDGDERYSETLDRFRKP